MIFPPRESGKDIQTAFVDGRSDHAVHHLDIVEVSPADPILGLPECLSACGIFEQAREEGMALCLIVGVFIRIKGDMRRRRARRQGGSRALEAAITAEDGSRPASTMARRNQLVQQRMDVVFI